ncbi:ribosome small subunit-dependent GTPase A [Leptospira sp. GIMC2001]|uniref:ribosome small subunit-dependent GTPase A n=1 Tax=Leptospira sp. GIMC2001 TaxID=1513297 RepID=UPI00234B1FA0|nr:ribosome small subunit-dependent GTPase A [Leptospira sp. GIMC2001]WCL48753.1 ribosome small subunit-dependent GTPase A [Leptospira sp. GIMC2001]
MPKELLLFRISRIFGAYYEVYSQELGSHLAVLKGKIRLQAKEERHPFVVGDMVWAEKSGDKWMIHSKQERKSLLMRKSSPRDGHALCSNADYAIVLASLKDPETKSGFIDRFLAAVSVSNMEPMIVFTKSDLVDAEELESRQNYYRAIGYKTHAISMTDLSGIDELKSIIQGKVCFLTGNSGVGKSTLVNILTGKIVAPTQEVSGSTHKGKHTTTNSFALFNDDGTVIIDSPGIKEWGLLHLTQDEIEMSFPELQRARQNCKSEFCCDLSETCEMQRSMEKLPDERIKSLESMIDSLAQPFRTTRRDHWDVAEAE